MLLAVLLPLRAAADDAKLLDLLRQKGMLTLQEYERLQAEGPTPPPQLGYEEGFFLRTQDGNLSLKFNGRVAANFLFLEPDTTQSDSETIDRARLGVDASFYRYFRLRLENDFTSSSGLRDAYLAFNYRPEFNLQIGQYKVPFSYEALLSKKYMDFVERAAVVSSTVSPSRDIGVMLYGAFFGKLLQYQLAGLNGSGQNRVDNNSDKDVAARLVLAPFTNSELERLRGLNVGGAVTYGHEPIDATKQASSIAGVTETGFTFFPAVQRHGERLRAGGQLFWLTGPWSLSGEYIHTGEARSDSTGSSLPDLDTDGAYLGGTWLLTGETKPFNARVRPARPFLSLTNPGWGAWEAALRGEFFKLRHGKDAPQESADENRYDAVVAGVNWYPNEFLRFSLNYLYGHFENAGPGLSPNPAKHSNNAVLGRAQLEF
jgi:phosphate-selective porin OprO/OprP